MALPLVLLLLLAVTSLAHGALSLALAERRAVRTHADVVAGRLKADAALDALLAVRSGDTLPDGSTIRDTLQGAPEGWLGVIEPLSREVVIVSALEDEPANGSARAARSALLWSLDPAERVAIARAAVSVGGDVHAPPGALSAAAYFRFPTSDAARCGGFTDQFDSLAVVHGVPTDVGRMAREDARDPFGPRVGPLPFDTVVRRLDRPLPEVVGSALPIGGSRRGAMTIQGGRGLTVLAVSGDLELRADTRLEGLLVVGGSLRILEGSSFRGSARVAGDLYIESGSFEGKACPAAAALLLNPRLRLPYLLPEPLSVPPPVDR